MTISHKLLELFRSLNVFVYQSTTLKASENFPILPEKLSCLFPHKLVMIKNLPHAGERFESQRPATTLLKSDAFHTRCWWLPVQLALGRSYNSSTTHKWQIEYI